MAVDIQDVKQVAQEIQGRFDEFKAINDKRIDAIEAEKGALSERVENLNHKLTELEQTKTSLEQELVALKRPSRKENEGTKAAFEHKEAFELFIRKGANEEELKQLEQKAMQTTTHQDGGHAIPIELDREIISRLKNDVIMRQESTVISMGTPNYKKLVNTGGITSGWVGETDTRPETNTPKLTAIEPVWGEIYANPQATQTMLDDAFFNVEQFLNDNLTEEFAEQEEAAFTMGDGIKKPKGFLAYGSDAKADKERTWGTLQHLLAEKAKEITADNLINLLYGLGKKYRANARFMLNNNTLCFIRTLKNQQGDYLWQPSIQLGQPSLLLGYGLAENEQMPDIAANAVPIAFGNFKRGYYIIDRIGVRMLRDPYSNKPFVGFYTTKRVGSMLVDSNAIKLLKMGATK